MGSGPDVQETSNSSMGSITYLAVSSGAHISSCFLCLILKKVDFNTFISFRFTFNPIIINHLPFGLFHIYRKLCVVACINMLQIANSQPWTLFNIILSIYSSLGHSAMPMVVL